MKWQFQFKCPFASNVEITRDEANFGVKVQADAVGYALEVCMEALFLTSRRASRISCNAPQKTRCEGLLI